MYALLCEHDARAAAGRGCSCSTSRSPRRSSPRRPTSRSRGVERKTDALWSAIGRRVRARRLPPEPGPLCDCCTFKPYCPATAATRCRPSSCAVPGTMIEPSLPLARHRRPDAVIDSRSLGRVRRRASTTRGRAASGTRRSIAVFYRSRARPTTACSGSSSAPARSRADAATSRVRAALRRRDGRRVGAHQRADQACSAGCARRRALAEGPLPYGMHRPITTSFPSGHATAAFTAADPARRAGAPRPWYRARRRRRREPGLRADAPRVRRRRRRRARPRASATPCAGSVTPAERRLSAGDHRAPATG